MHSAVVPCTWNVFPEENANFDGFLASGKSFISSVLLPYGLVVSAGFMIAATSLALMIVL